MMSLIWKPKSKFNHEGTTMQIRNTGGTKRWLMVINTKKERQMGTWRFTMNSYCLIETHLIIIMYQYLFCFVLYREMNCVQWRRLDPHTSTPDTTTPDRGLEDIYVDGVILLWLWLSHRRGKCISYLIMHNYFYHKYQYEWPLKEI